VFQGKLAALAAIGAAATADRNVIKKGAIDVSAPGQVAAPTSTQDNNVKHGTRKSRRKAAAVSRKKK
jgi:hypothetical protein